MLLYVHVPFCVSKCRYCAFASEVLDMDALDAWTKALDKEAAHYGRLLSRPEVRTVYLGGGTPSLLPSWAFSRVAENLKRHFIFSAGLEYSIEANPDSCVDTDLMAQWRQAGINRVSLGVQALQDDMLRVLGRPHTVMHVHAAVDRLRAAGFLNLSMDLMWGLPGQRLRDWMATLKAAVRLAPEHISAYGLTLEEGAPLTHDVEGGLLALPGEDEASKMYVHGGNYLEDMGYMHYEISNFGRMGFFSLHNQGYWDGEDYIGLGPSAVSTLQGRRWENPRSVAQYVQAAKTGAWGKDAETLSPEIRARERLMLALRTSKGMRLADYKHLTGRDLASSEGKLLGALVQKDLIRIRDGSLRLTRSGMLVSNLIIGRFLFPD